MTRRGLFEILRKINIAFIVLCVIAVPVGIVLTVLGFGDMLAEVEMIGAIGGILILIPVVLIIALALNCLILKIMATSQSTVLILVMIAIQVISNLGAGIISVPVFYVLALFLPKE